VHRGDDRLSGAEQSGRLLVEMAAGAAAACFRDRSGLQAPREIGAGTKRPSFRREHDRPASGVGIEPFERFADFGDQVAIEEIVRRPAHLDRRDVAVLADTDVAHLEISSGLPFDDQRIDHGEALTLRMDDDRVEVDFLDQIGMVGGETRQSRH